MAAQDIRRQTGDVSPVNYIRPGVENRGIEQAIKAVVGGGLAIDTAIQTKKLASQLDEARAARIVGSPAMQQEDEVSDGQLQMDLDKHLAPFKNVLQNRKRAVEQGSITADRFELEADAILQRAIAKRPGLAPEFRQLHSEFTGGYLLEELTRREAEMLQELEASKKSAAANADDRMKWQAERLREIGLDYEAGVVFGDPEAMDQLFREHQQDISRRGRTKADAEYWRDSAGTQESIDKLDKPSAMQAWNSAFNEVWENVGASVNMSQQALQGANEDEFAAMITDFNTALLKAKADLQAQRGTLKLSPDEVAPQMAQLDDLQASANKLLDGSISLDQRKKTAEIWQLKLQAQLRQDAPLIATIAALEQVGGPETVKQVTRDSAVLNQQQSEELHNFVVDRGQYRPETINSLAAGQAAAMLKDVFPEGTATDAPVRPGSIKLLAKQGTAFAVTPADKFKINLYNDWIREISFYGEPLAEKLPDELRTELANAVSMAAYKSVRTRILQLYQDVPSLTKRLKGNSSDFGSEDVIVPKEGESLSPAEQQAVDVANSQLNYGQSLKLVKQLYKVDDLDKAGQHIWNAQELVQGATNLRAVEQREAASKPRARGGQGGGGSAGGEGRLGPNKGDVVLGHEFLGGDPNDKANWKPVE